MATARIDKKTYQMLLRAYRERPGNFSHAGQYAGVTHRTAKRAFQKGWSSPPWARPIAEVLEAEKHNRRAQIRAEQAEQALEAPAKRADKRTAAFDAAAERLTEAKAVRGALQVTLGMLATVSTLQTAGLAAAQYAAQQITDKIKAKDLSYKEAVQLTQQLGLAAERTVRSLREAQQAVRLHLGESGSIVTIQQSGPSPVVEGEAALAALGPERVQQAVEDLMAGKVTDDVDALINWQVTSAGPAH